ncbi:MAG: hypothetical protein V4563_04250 [Pseudomonadota bacterium]
MLSNKQWLIEISERWAKCGYAVGDRAAKNMLVCRAEEMAGISVAIASNNVGAGIY